MILFKDSNTGHIAHSLIFLDIDGTLINDNEHALDEATLKKIAQLQRANRVYLCSNSRNHERNLKVAALSGVEYLHTDLRKPDKKIMELIDPHPFNGRRWVIGDKFMTDGRFARKIGAQFLKVKRITSKKDRLYIKFLYWIDDVAGLIASY